MKKGTKIQQNQNREIPVKIIRRIHFSLNQKSVAYELKRNMVLTFSMRQIFD